MGVPLKTPEEDEIIEGWVGQPKGMLQVLWERGFIDESNLKSYTIAGKKDAFGAVDLSTSLKSILGNCTDLAEEECLLQSMGRKMGIIIDRTPKCHAEIAGEGIEYTWGFQKNHFRRQPISMKRSKTEFRKLVRKCCSRELVTKAIVRKFSKRARDYIIAYHTVENHNNEIKKLTLNKKGNAENTVVIDDSTVVKVERMKREFKTHRCAMDFDTKFLKSDFHA